MDKTTKLALKLADAVLAALAAGDDYHEILDEYDSRIATKRQSKAVASAEKKFNRLSQKAYELAGAVKGSIVA